MKTILIFILALVFSSTIHAQTTAIPDANFEQKLIALGIDTDGWNGQILNSDAAGVMSLNVSNSNISSLTGIEAFVNLTSLQCSYNNLTSLDLSANTGLDTLICYQSNLTSLDLSANTMLRCLFCSNNNLPSLNLSANVALTNLICDGTSLTNLDISNNIALSYLYCSNSSLTSLDVSNNIALTDLNCSGNNLTSLDVSNNTALINLICGNNNLLSLDVSNNIALRYLHCMNTPLTSLDVSNNINLANLVCSYNNNLASLNVGVITTLTSLGCQNGNLTSLDISTNAGLTSLNCNNNNLTSLDVSNNTALTTLYCYNNNLTNLDVSNNNVLAIFNCSNNTLSSLNLTTNTNLYSFNCQNNLPYLRICVPNVQAANNNPNWYKNASAIYLENCYPISVTGKVVIDANTNCNADSSEQGLLGHFVQFVRNSDATTSYFTPYDSLGNYIAYLDTGIYTIMLIPSSPYWQSCPNSQQVTIDTNYNIQTINWTLQSLISCPFLEVDISAPLLRMAGSGSYYTVSYCNNGTIAAANAYVEIDLDGDLNYLGATIPLVSQNGTVYTFNLGTVAVGECNNFQINVIVDTSALFAQTHCTEAHIYPDSICIPIWSGPIVSGNVSCQNDSVFFYIENTGAAMLQSQPFSIIEDNIAMRIGTIQLGAGQSTTIAQAAAAGKTYRIEVQQLAGFPALLGNPSFSAAIEGCNPHPNGSFNTGFITQFSNGYSSPFIAVDCQQNVGGWDPNDKAAQPEGYGLAHYIETTTAIDYKVRFQNTGTDTAFNIVVVDTLSPYLDIASLTMGASSHHYDWRIEDGNVLKVSFLNIMLVDSNANEPLSHGFFRYRIEQKPNNPLGSVINNQAAIYFDYNAAVMTNTTFHTVGENFVTIILSIGEIYDQRVNVTAFPNPFTNTTTIKVEGKEYSELQLSVFDITGRAVAQEQTSFNNQIELGRGNLQPGVYIYQLRGDGKVISVGKVVVQ